MLGQWAFYPAPSSGLNLPLLAEAECLHLIFAFWLPVLLGPLYWNSLVIRVLVLPLPTLKSSSHHHQGNIKTIRAWISDLT